MEIVGALSVGGASKAIVKFPQRNLELLVSGRQSIGKYSQK